MAGGQVIHVQGRGFGKMKDSITIDVGGVPCKVVEAQESEVACVLATGNSMMQDTYRGGAGVRITYYEDVNGMHSFPPRRFRRCLMLSSLAKIH